MDKQKCGVRDCNNVAKFADPVEGVICEECMEQDISEGSYDPEDFEALEEVSNG